MKNKNIIIGAAVAALMGVVSVANAGTALVSASTPLIFTTQHSVAADKLNVVTGGSYTATIAATAGTAGIQNGDTVTFTLSGGAKFDAATWALEVAKPGFLIDAAGNTATVTGCTLNAGLTVLTCTGGVANAANSLTTFTITTAALYDLDLATADATLTISVSRAVLGTATVVHTDAAPKKVFTVTNALQVATAVTEGGAQVANVTALFKTFVTAGTAGTATNKDTNNTTGVASTTGSSTAVGQAQATGKFLLTLTNLPTAATKVTLATAGGIASSDATGAAKAATNGGTFWLDGAGKGYAFLIGTANLPTLANLGILVDGTTPITAGSPQLTITYLAGAKFLAHTVLAATNIATITRNGANFSANVVLGTDQFVITNNGAAGAVTITATDNAGAAITANAGAVALPTTIAAGASIVVNGADLIANFTAASRYNFVIESSDIDATLIHVVPGVGASTTVINTNATPTQVL